MLYLCSVNHERQCHPEKHTSGIRPPDVAGRLIPLSQAKACKKTQEIMAKIFYELKQNNNEDSKVYLKWFAYGKTVETLNTRKLAQHIAEHGSIYTPDVVYGVLEKFRSCLVEMLLESKRVKIDGLGIFYTTIENEKGGATSEDDFSVNSNLKALHIRFLPEQAQEQNISSREFFKKAEFVNVKSLTEKKKPSTEPEMGNGTGGDDPGEGD